MIILAFFKIILNSGAEMEANIYCDSESEWLMFVGNEKRKIRILESQRDKRIDE